MSEDEFPFTFSVPEQAFKRTFKSAADAKLFFSEEQQKYLRLTEKISTQPFLNILKYSSPTLDQVAASIDANSKPAQIWNAYNTFQPILMSGKFGAKAVALSEEDTNRVPGYLWAARSTFATEPAPRLQNPTWSPTISSILAGGLTEVLNTNPKRSAQNAQYEQIIETALDTHERLEIQLGEAKETSDDATEILNDFKIQSQNEIKALRDMLAKTLVDEAKKTSDLEEEVRKRLLLEAPTKYWTEKEARHNRVAIGFSVLFVVIVGAGVYWLTHGGITTVTTAATALGLKEGIGALIPLAFITVPTLAVAWLLRHVSRIIIQNLSLAADAGLRGTIALTYSALTHKGETNAGELALALQALFRPIDGSEHAEVAPPNLTDIMRFDKQ